jgi:LmbE family N-acetylglucosaminyl deacetylase
LALPSISRLVVISPHLDDGVLSCGDLLAAHPGAVVITAFAGRPAVYPPLTSWDERGGFEDGADVVAARRSEDEQALAVLGARPCWLPFPDPQYGARPSRRDVAEALSAALDTMSPETVAMPLGIFHDDHILASDAAIEAAFDARRRQAAPTWLVYADAIYRPLPDLVDRRLQELGERGLSLREVDVRFGAASDLKRRAAACYRSQVRALERSWESGVSDALEPERYWQVARVDAAQAGRVRPAERGPHGNGC